jgi:hypothetical protein
MQVIGDDQRHESASWPRGFPQEFEIVAAGEAVMNYDGYFLHALARLRNERRYRVFSDLERIAERYP